jgi:hypothetical protein
MLMGVGMGLLVGEVLGGHFAADVFLIALGVALFVYNALGLAAADTVVG